MTGGALDLREEWADLLRRRPGLAGALALHGVIVEAWASRTGGLAPLVRGPAACRECWERGVPLVVEAPPVLEAPACEAVLAPVMDALAASCPATAPSLQRFAEGWDRGAIVPLMLLPAKGRMGTVPEDVWFDPPLAAFLAMVVLRPVLGDHFAGCRAHADALEGWTLGICPFCGSPPAFADLTEDGRRRLACHLCGGEWVFSRLRCPLCGTGEARDQVRLQAEREEEGYAVAACQACRGYVKELDRRVRWNGRSAVVEDWGSPHLDLVARRAGFWRPIPSLIDLAGGP